MFNKRSSQDLRAELTSLADALDEALSQGADKSRSELKRLHHKAHAALDTTRKHLGESGERLAQSTRDAADKAETYVRDKPLHGVGIGAAIGLVIGILISRR